MRRRRQRGRRGPLAARCVPGPAGAVGVSCAGVVQEGRRSLARYLRPTWEHTAHIRYSGCPPNLCTLTSTTRTCLTPAECPAPLLQCAPSLAPAPPRLQRRARRASPPGGRLACLIYCPYVQEVFCSACGQATAVRNVITSKTISDKSWTGPKSHGEGLQTITGPDDEQDSRSVRG